MTYNKKTDNEQKNNPLCPRKYMEDYLYLKGLSFDSLTPGKRNRYEKIALAVGLRLLARNEAERVIKDNKVTIHAVSEETGVSNKTIYNDDILRGFIQSNASPSDENTSTLLAVRNELKEANNIIHKLKRSAVSKQILKDDIRSLEKEVEL